MPPAQRYIRHAPEHSSQQSHHETPPSKPVGRPKGAPSTIINLRLPLDLLSRLDRYLDYREVHTGLKANRGMMARRALELFLETHPIGNNAPQT